LLEEPRLPTIAEPRLQRTAESRPPHPVEVLPLNTNGAKAHTAREASAPINREASIAHTRFGDFLMFVEPRIYSPTEHRDIMYHGILKYVARGATTYNVLGALAPHTIGTLAPLTPEFSLEWSFGSLNPLRLILQPHIHVLE